MRPATACGQPTAGCEPPWANGHATTLNGTEDLVLGIDGGGTRTVALLASRAFGWRLDTGPRRGGAHRTGKRRHRRGAGGTGRAAEGAFVAAGRPANRSRPRVWDWRGPDGRRTRNRFATGPTACSGREAVDVIEDTRTPTGRRHPGWLRRRGRGRDRARWRSLARAGRPHGSRRRLGTALGRRRQRLRPRPLRVAGGHASR